MKRYIKSAIINPLDEDLPTKVLIARTSGDTELLRSLYEYANNNPNRIFHIINESLLKNPNTPKDIIDVLIDDDFYARQYACLDDASPDILAEIERKHRRHKAIPSFLAQNPNTPNNILKKYFEVDVLRGYAAMNPGLSNELMTELAHSSSAFLRGCVASNPSISPELLTELSEDSDEEVRGDVAGNSNTPVEVLLRLTNDSSSGVRVSARITLQEEHNL